MEHRGRLAIVLVIAAICLIAVPGLWLVGSKKNNSAYARLDEYEASKAALNTHDLQIYWIGELPERLQGMDDVISVIEPGTLTGDNMPIKVSSFHITTYNENGDVIDEQIPRDYASDMLIVLYNVTILDNSDKEILSDCVTANGVPVLAIGESSVGIVRDMLMYSRDMNSNKSFVYELGLGYTNSPLDEAKVMAGGLDLGEEFISFINERFGYNEEIITSESSI
ncbi:MAG: hypothetical protein K5745_00710 [Saccharofermentans sp.]|nr:hypothetical protein [Saccharofermentans sp.]